MAVRFGLKVAALGPAVDSIEEFGIGVVGRLQVIEADNIKESFAARQSLAIEPYSANYCKW